MGILRQMAEYLYIKKKRTDVPADSWMKYMHGMNRISLIIFLLGLLVMLFKLVIRPMLMK
ncbi:MAG: DUF6728 family protein [Bacteroidota bacterium]|jgi:hypothetical protein